MSVEKYHHVLNETQATAGQDKGTHGVFIQNVKTSHYSWNSATIDGTYIIRSVAAIGQEFRFPLDIGLLQTPTNLNQGNYGLYEYIRHISNNYQF